MGILLKLGKLSRFWGSLKTDPFKYYDNLSIKWRHIDFNILKDDVSLRRIVLYFSIVLTIVWFVMGFDSGIGQVEWPILYILGNLFLKGQTYGNVMTFDGQITGEGLRYWYDWSYGKYMHWSAFVIYGFAFVLLSKYFYEKLNIKGSQNTVYSFSAVLLSVSIFEWFWMGSYYLFQGQPWILMWQWPQMRILIQNSGFGLLGLVFLFHILAETYLKPRVDWKVLLFTGLAVGSCLLWWYYPWPVHGTTVETTTGIWVNSQNFPQTTYTVDLDPLDKTCAGVQVYLEDNLVHLVNTIAKVMVTVAIVGVCALVPRRGQEWRGSNNADS